MADLLLCPNCCRSVLEPGSVLCYGCYLESLPSAPYWDGFGEYYDPDDDES